MMHTRAKRKTKINDTEYTEAILSNEDRKLNFETSSNGYDTQMRREVKEKRKTYNIKHRHTT